MKCTWQCVVISCVACERRQKLFGVPLGRCDDPNWGIESWLPHSNSYFCSRVPEVNSEVDRRRARWKHKCLSNDFSAQLHNNTYATRPRFVDLEGVPAAFESVLKPVSKCPRFLELGRRPAKGGLKVFEQNHPSTGFNSFSTEQTYPYVYIYMYMQMYHTHTYINVYAYREMGTQIYTHTHVYSVRPLPCSKLAA